MTAAVGDVPGRVVVVGGGLAGLTAAIALADAGRPVLLLEGSPRLGGLTRSYRHGDLLVDNGQHVFLRCCDRYRGFLERLGVTSLVHLQPRLDVPVLEPGRPPARLRRTGLPAPLHLSRSLATYGPLSLRQRLAAVRGALALTRVDPADPATDQRSFGEWLAEHGQDARTVAALWDLVGVATLNAPAGQASLALAATVFQLGLLNTADAGDIGWSMVPLARLHAEPAAAALAAAGAEVRTRARVDGLVRDPDGWRVQLRSGAEERADAVVLAVPPPQAEQLLPAGAVDLPAGWAEQLGASPIVNVHVVYDRQVLLEPFVAALGSPVQFAFDRTEQVGLATGQCIGVSLSAADAFIDLPTAQLRALIEPALAALLPPAREAIVTDVFVTRERAATFRPKPGSAALRPGAATAVPGLVVAGAWTDTGWPATMEGAVRSGEGAAAALLSIPSPRPDILGAAA
jgi:squalene-associated FAD-dependent desaturase